jgi:hypothetical protein
MAFEEEKKEGGALFSQAIGVSFNIFNIDRKLSVYSNSFKYSFSI